MSAVVKRRQTSGAARREPRTPLRRVPSRYVPLLHRVIAIDVLLLVAAVVVTVVVLAPAKISAFALDEEVAVLAVAVALVVTANVYLVRRVVAPIQDLTAFARKIDLGTIGQGMPDAKPTSEAGELAITLNEMLVRIENERRESTGRVLRAQESERLRIAQELHDQVGQQLTAALLGLARVSSQTPTCLHDDVSALQNVVRNSLDDVRRIALELRPEALDDLGLPSALAVLSERFAEQGNLEVSEHIACDLPALPADTELVVYRVAQEAITNVARHSASNRADLTLAYHDGKLVLSVRDYGLGLAPGVSAGTGMRGMRERAALIGAQVTIANAQPGPGCEVRLEVPDTPLQ